MVTLRSLGQGTQSLVLTAYGPTYQPLSPDSLPSMTTSGVLDFVPPSDLPWLPHKQYPSKHADRTGMDASVRIYSALFDQGQFDESFSSQMATATAPALAAFNKLGQPIGVANTMWNLDDDNMIENGAYKDFALQQTAGPGQQVEYIQVYATGTPICLPGLTIRMADGTHAGFLGDFGHACGAAWYYSNIDFGDGGHEPDCIWLDSGKRNDEYTNGEECVRRKQQCEIAGNYCEPCDVGDKTLKYQFPTNLRYLPKAMQITLSAFTQQSKDDKPPELATLCGEHSLTFRHYLNADFEYRPNKFPHFDSQSGQVIDPPSVNPSFNVDNVTMFEQGSDLSSRHKRSEEEAAAASATDPAHAWNFYVSSFKPEHSAMKLCTSVTSLGPDLFSEHERKFCDMGAPGTGSRNLYDVCDERNIKPCWNRTAHKVEGVDAKNGNVVTTKRMQKWSGKTYTHKVEWKSNGVRNIVKVLGS